MRVHLAAGLLAAAVATGGCYASAGYSTGYVAPQPVYTTSATATVEVDTYQPDLVDVGGGVRVIADYEEPIFYTDNYYWRFYGGTWYRSSVYNGGWVVYNDIPYSVRRIDRPNAYVRYRPAGYQPRARRDPYVRDHRGHDGGYRPAPGPTVRDHRGGGGYDGSGINPGGGPAVRDHRGGGGYDGSGINPGGGPTVRDHRTDRPAPAPGPTVRDHRTHDRPAPAPAPGPTVRDHRTERPAPAPGPTVRDHRDNRREAPGPTVRDHRRR